MPKKKPYQKKSYESIGEPSDTSANIYHSMLVSNAWKSLTAKQKVLYQACKDQVYREKRKPQTKEYPNGNEQYFTMNRHKWSTVYELYIATNKSGFYRDRDALIEKGFIRVIENGQHSRSNTIYAFSDMWKKWGQSGFVIDVASMSDSMLRRLN